MKFTSKTFLYILPIFICFPLFASAAMQSSSYVIYENVNHAFDGPVISSVSRLVSGQSVTVTWNTDVLSDGFVEYSADASFVDSKEQGSSLKNTTAHSVLLSGLAANTLYYYRVRSTRVNGGVTVSTPTANTFTTGSDTPAEEGGDEEEAETYSPGGGTLIIDKTDKAAPLITDVRAVGVSYSSIEITWETDEEATSFVEYGQSLEYGLTYGHWGTSTAHSVALINLLPSTFYNFRVLSSDSWGNVSYSENYVFSTAAGEGEEAIVDEEEVDIEEEPRESQEDLVLDMLSRLFPEVSLNQLGPNPLETIRDRYDIINLIAAPILSGQPIVEAGANEAVIRWTTDIDSNSLVALSPDEGFVAGAAEPYRQIVGNPELYTTEHEVRLYNLNADTLYHFQLRSKPELGPMARSRDFTFQTALEELTITSFFPQIIDEQTVTFKWVTNKESDSAVTFAPYHNNVLAVDRSKTIRDNSQSTIHEITIEEFIGGTQYRVDLVSQDTAGNIAQETFEAFSTAEDDSSPEITHIKADSTIFVDRGNKIQTIISWMTNEPSTSKVYFQEGVHGGNQDLAESTSLNTNYTKEHVMVITDFNPGVVYTFRVESIDSGGNTTISKSHTFMTAKKKESIVQVIMGILENTFGWLKKLM